MLKLTVDGARHSGTYRVDCECGQSWTGQGEPAGVGNWNPALAVAECVVHMKLGHQELTMNLDFSPRFRDWLVGYWQRASQRSGTKSSLYRAERPRTSA